MFDKNTLYRIKDSIIIKDDFYWQNMDVNCYGYSINVDLSKNEVCYDNKDYNEFYGFNLGTVSGNYSHFYSDSDVKNVLYDDCDALDLNIKEVDYKCELQKRSEWLISLYNSESFYQDGRIVNDYHFLKKLYGIDKWSHKRYMKEIKYVDDNNNELDDLTNAKIFVKCMGKTINYKYIGSFVLSKKKG